MTNGTSTSRPTIVAVVGDDGRFDHVRQRAIELAREQGASVVLYDVDAGNRLLESPRPNEWSAEGEQEQFGPRLDVNDLEALGRAPLARQVQATRAEGVDAWAWLPEKNDPESLRDYVGRLGAARVVVAEEERDLASALPGGAGSVEVLPGS